MNVLSSIDTKEPTATETADELWYKDAIIYQLHVKAFADSNNDGIGDFAGLTEKLRLSAGARRHRAVAAAVLSVARAATTATTSPTIGDINPDFGTMKDFRRFIQEAKKRGLRVITELVINHTSDQHAWFKRARRSRPGLERAQLVCLERHRPALSGHADHLHRYREVELDLGSRGRRVSTGTASSRISRTSISTIRAWSAPSSR